MQLAPSGHCPDGSGLQRHSIGGLYPLVIVGFGDDTWGVQLPCGEVVRRRWWHASMPPFYTVGEAQDYAESIIHLFRE